MAVMFCAKKMLRLDVLIFSTNFSLMRLFLDCSYFSSIFQPSCSYKVCSYNNKKRVLPRLRYCFFQGFSLWYCISNYSGIPSGFYNIFASVRVRITCWVFLQSLYCTGRKVLTERFFLKLL